MLIAPKIRQLSLVGCTYNWHKRYSARKLLFCIPPPVALVHFAVDSTILWVSKVHQFKIEVRLRWEMCQMELNEFENNTVE
jgi:hypothetical protein